MKYILHDRNKYWADRTIYAIMKLFLINQYFGISI